MGTRRYGDQNHHHKQQRPLTYSASQLIGQKSGLRCELNWMRTLAELVLWKVKQSERHTRRLREQLTCSLSRLPASRLYIV